MKSNWPDLWPLGNSLNVFFLNTCSYIPVKYSRDNSLAHRVWFKERWPSWPCFDVLNLAQNYVTVKSHVRDVCYRLYDRSNVKTGVRVMRAWVREGVPVLFVSRGYWVLSCQQCVSGSGGNT